MTRSAAVRESIRRRVAMIVVACGLVLLTDAGSSPARADDAPPSFTACTVEVEGATVHYVIGGHGPALILLHGYAETSRMWRPIMPLLAKRFTVIAPDLPGIGASPIPETGLDVTTSAVRIHALARSLGLESASVVGHDIGLMVAYAYAAQFPAETQKLVVMDAFLPGVVGWEAIYNDPGLWHFRFYGPTPEALVKGRERIYLDHFWNDFAADETHSIPEVDRKAYTAAYARPGRMQAGWAYFAAFPDTAKDFARFAETKLTIPVLAIGGDKSLGDALATQMNAVATDVKTVVLEDTGHWVLEERPKETTDALVQFLSPDLAKEE